MEKDMTTTEIVALVDQVAADQAKTPRGAYYIAIFEEVAQMAGIDPSDVADAIAANVMAAVRAG
jgi:hypothetical protein